MFLPVLAAAALLELRRVASVSLAALFWSGAAAAMAAAVVTVPAVAAAVPPGLSKSRDGGGRHAIMFKPIRRGEGLIFAPAQDEQVREYRRRTRTNQKLTGEDLHQDDATDIPPILLADYRYRWLRLLANKRISVIRAKASAQQGPRAFA
jgi:hypothetical protein